MNALICNIALAVFFLGGVMFGRWLDSRFKGYPTTDETARSYLFYMSILKDLNSLNDATLVDAFVNDSLKIKENLFKGTSDPVAFEFFFKWEESIQARKETLKIRLFSKSRRMRILAVSVASAIKHCEPQGLAVFVARNHHISLPYLELWC